MVDPFQGTWNVDLTSKESRIWDAEKETYVADNIGSEITKMKIENGVQEYEVLYGQNPTLRMGYTSRYDSTDWAPYTVRGIEGVPEQDQERAAIEFRERTKSPYPFAIGKPIQYVRTIKVDERTHYRISKDVNGQADFILMRRMDESQDTAPSKSSFRNWATKPWIAEQRQVLEKFK
ncbi:hypothetical protein LTS17_005621 [Exophiala oligosperma]